MRSRAAVLAASIGAFALAAHADEKAWEFVATGYWNAPKGGDDFASAIFTADRDPWHLEARANYEAVHARSAFVGYSFSWGKDVTLDLRPIVGGVTGAARGPIGGFEATLAGGPFDYYIEAEHVNDRVGGSYNYAWTELGWRPAEWLRVGFAGQRTRVYGGDRETQRGGLVQLTQGKFTLSAYWFNPGSSDQIVIGALGVAF
ncbi:MAG TPA: hypothetical protein VLT60_06005 [Usitatibacter sp.]|nr:hypothetical protein [Usitatibacter sp.]